MGWVLISGVPAFRVAMRLRWALYYRCTTTSQGSCPGKRLRHILSEEFRIFVSEIYYSDSAYRVANEEPMLYINS